MPPLRMVLGRQVERELARAAAAIEVQRQAELQLTPVAIVALACLLLFAIGYYFLIRRQTAPFTSSSSGGYEPGSFPVPENEADRLRLLRSLDILDSSAEASFDHVTDWGREFFDVPVCLISLVDADRQWFKACYGLGAKETTRDVSFCAHAIMPKAPEVFEVCDASEDTRFANNPLVTGAPFIRHYAGAPLLMEGHKLGTLCIIDTASRPPLTPSKRASFLTLAAMVSDQLTSRLQSKRMEVMNRKLEEFKQMVNHGTRALTLRICAQAQACCRAALLPLCLSALQAFLACWLEGFPAPISRRLDSRCSQCPRWSTRIRPTSTTRTRASRSCPTERAGSGGWIPTRLSRTPAPSSASSTPRTSHLL